MHASESILFTLTQNITGTKPIPDFYPKKNLIFSVIFLRSMPHG